LPAYRRPERAVKLATLHGQIEFIGNKMDVTQAQIESLKAHLKEMSAADLSILDALTESLKQEETVSLATTPGSKNDLLWSQMAVLGWMKLDKPLAEHAASKVYIVNREAREPLEALLIDLKRDELPKLFNQLRREIPPMIAPPVIAAGGAPADVALMLAGIVEATMRRWIKPGLHKEFLQAVFDRARDLGQGPKS
jgi:hypothetical protein